MTMRADDLVAGDKFTLAPNRETLYGEVLVKTQEQPTADVSRHTVYAIRLSDGSRQVLSKGDEVLKLVM